MFNSTIPQQVSYQHARFLYTDDVLLDWISGLVRSNTSLYLRSRKIDRFSLDSSEELQGVALRRRSHGLTHSIPFHSRSMAMHRESWKCKFYKHWVTVISLPRMETGTESAIENVQETRTKKKQQTN